jgi:hypothetical protein
VAEMINEIPTNVKEQIINNYIDGTSIRALSIQYNYGYDRVRRLIKKANIEIRGNDFNSKKFKNNSHVFDVIDTEEKAYWLGFLYADGCVMERENFRLQLSLSANDIEHLKLFQSFMQTDNPIRIYDGNHNNQYCRIIIIDNYLCKQLIEKGCFQNKTGKIIYPRFLNESLHKHFIRGYVDGNGCITFHKVKANPNRLAFALKIDSTREMLFEFNKLLPVKNKKEIPKLYKRRDNNVNDYSLEYGGNKQVLQLLDYLYGNSTIYLQRKYERYLLLKNMYS